MKNIITGFHAIEEKIKKCENAKKMRLFVAKSGPRVKKIVGLAESLSIKIEKVDEKSLDLLCKNLSENARDHRGIALEIDEVRKSNLIDFDLWIKTAQNAEKSTVLILDSITDPHNVGAILRSADQFSTSLVILSAHNSQNDIAHNEIVARASAGASTSVPTAIVTNLVRTAKMLKEAGFWIYGADAGGKNIKEINFAPKTALVMGSEGNGISRLLQEQCDEICSIPTNGTIDSLNVSVAAGILLYEISSSQKI